MYQIVCEKETSECSKFVPNYVGECGDGEISSFTHSYASHMGTATQASQVKTTRG